MAMDHWGSMFEISKVLPKGASFTGTVETDGVSACIHFMAPRAEPRPSQEAPSKKRRKKGIGNARPAWDDMSTHRVVAIDPGRINIVTAVERLGDGTVRKHRLTRRQYYRESGIRDGNRRTALWCANIHEEIDALSKVCSKGPDLGAYVEFLEVDIVVAENIWRERLKRRWGEQSLRVYGGKNGRSPISSTGLKVKVGCAVISAPS
jgi:hypothetical protein